MYGFLSFVPFVYMVCLACFIVYMCNTLFKREHPETNTFNNAIINFVALFMGNSLLVFVQCFGNFVCVCVFFSYCCCCCSSSLEFCYCSEITKWKHAQRRHNGAIILLATPHNFTHLPTHSDTHTHKTQKCIYIQSIRKHTHLKKKK